MIHAHAAGRIEPSPMFVVRGGQLTPVADAGAFHLAGHDPADVRVLPDHVLAALPKDAGAPAAQQITLDLDSDLGAAVALAPPIVALIMTIATSGGKSASS